MRVVEINTTAWSDENLFIITNLTDKQIEKVIEPIVSEERENEKEYDNDDLLSALKKAYPKKVIMDGEADYLSF